MFKPWKNVVVGDCVTFANRGSGTLQKFPCLDRESDVFMYVTSIEILENNLLIELMGNVYGEGMLLEEGCQLYQDFRGNSPEELKRIRNDPTIFEMAEVWTIEQVLQKPLSEIAEFIKV